MNSFNTVSRTRNVFRASSVSTACTALNILLGFAYRTLFIKILSENYLGISGLFTNILTVLSLTELGITDALNFRLYEPIHRGDVLQVGKIMNFFRRVYLAIAAAILALGLCLMPFLGALIKDAGEVPPDVDLQFVYLLFLLQSVVSYTYSYKQMLLAADQKQHIFALFQSLLSFSRYAVQLLFLLLTKNYTLTLISGIAVTLLINFSLSFWTQRKYSAVFSVRESLSKAEKQQIFSDTTATMCHKVGTVVLTGTDNILVTKFVGLSVTGIFSNYSMLLTYLQSLFTQALGSFSSSFGSAHTALDSRGNYAVFQKMQFVCFWVASAVTVCIYVLLNDFIFVWLGSAMLLDRLTVAALSAQFYLGIDRLIIVSYTCGSGLFVKDKLRPLLEALINLFVSIWLVLKIGLSGIFFGTVISHLCTISWRGPYILYRYEFKTSGKRYWLAAIFFAAFTGIMCWGMSTVKAYLSFQVSGFGAWILEGVLCFATVNLVLLLLLFRTGEFQFFLSLIKKKMRHRT